MLIFAHHQEVLDRLQEEVMETGDRKFVRIDGQVGQGGEEGGRWGLGRRL